MARPVVAHRLSALLKIFQEEGTDFLEAELAQKMSCTSRSVRRYIQLLRELDRISVVTEKPFKFPGGGWVNKRHIFLKVG